MKYNLRVMFFVILFVSLNTLAWGDRTNKTSYCGAVKDKAAKAVCEAAYDRNIAYLTKEHMKICSDMLDVLEDVQVKKWEHAAGCLDLLAGRSAATLPAEQLKVCTKLMKSSKSTTNFLFCVQEYEPELFNFCKLPMDAGAYAVAKDCLVYMQAGTVKNIDVKALREECEPGAIKAMKEKWVASASWAPYASCLSRYVPDGDSSRRVNPETGEVTPSKR